MAICGLPYGAEHKLLVGIHLQENCWSKSRCQPSMSHHVFSVERTWMNFTSLRLVWDWMRLIYRHTCIRAAWCVCRRRSKDSQHLNSGKIEGMDKTANPSKRIAYLDIAKGIGILLVVLGHNYVRISIPGMGKFIFSFHMPFFFLLSGMLFKAHYPILVLFKRRFATLIRPYLVSIVILYSV